MMRAVPLFSYLFATALALAPPAVVPPVVSPVQPAAVASRAAASVPHARVSVPLPNAPAAVAPRFRGQPPIAVTKPFTGMQAESTLTDVLGSPSPAANTHYEPEVQHAQISASATKRPDQSSSAIEDFMGRWEVSLGAMMLVTSSAFVAGRGKRDRARPQTRGSTEMAVLSGGAPRNLVASKVALAAEAGEAAVTPTKTEEGGLDVKLIIYIALWYVGNYYYNITNKLALKAAGGATGFPMTIATLQLGVGCIYSWFLWAAPDARPTPKLSWKDIKKTLPVGFTSAGAHAASVFALSAGAVSFGQIVKAAEPAFAALLGTLFYGASISTAKWLCLIPIIGGVVLASLAELDFAWAALFTAAMANIFAAVKANENKKLMNTEGLKDRMGSVGNQFAITMNSSFLFCLVLMFITEGSKLGSFFRLVRGGGMGAIVLNNLVASGIWFYLYNELATITIKKTGAVTQSVLNTAKRAVVILGVAVVLGESLDPLKLTGSMVCIGGVFLYSVIDRLVKKK